MNVWTVVTRLGADAELRTTQTGTAVCSFRGAVDSGYGDRKVTTWVNFTLWGGRAEALAPILTKGKQVAVSGEVSLREYEKRDGTTGSSLEVNVREITLVGPRQDDGHPPRTGGRSGGGGGGGRRRADPPPRHDDLYDEIPF